MNIFREALSDIEKDIEKSYEKMSPEEIQFHKVYRYLHAKQFETFILTGIWPTIEEILLNEKEEE